MRQKTDQSGERRCAVIDIGTNSLKLIIGEIQNDEVVVLEFLKKVVPIGNATFYTGALSSDITKQIVTILDNYRLMIREYDVAQVRVIATTAIREARNRDIVVDTVKRKTGFEVEVLTAGDVIYFADSYLSHSLQNKYPLSERNILIAELGAGSLDVSTMQKGLTQVTVGLPIGTLRLQQLLGKLDGSLAENQDTLEEYIENEFASLKRLLPPVQVDDIFLLDETYARHLRAIQPALSDNGVFFQYNRQHSEEMLERLKDKTGGELASGYGIPLECADRMYSYAVILRNLGELAGAGTVHILETALAEAVLANVLLGPRLSQRFNKQEQLISTAQFLCRRFNLDVAHAQQVANLSEILFNNLKGHLGLRDGELIYLLLAAYLHDIGMFIHNRAHHKHSEYIIASIGLFRLSEDEMRLIACVARYHRKSMPRNDHLCYSMLSREEQILVQKLAALLRLANALDCSHRRKVSSLQVEFSRNRDITLQVSSSAGFMLESLEFNEKKSLFEEITGSQIRLIVKG